MVLPYFFAAASRTSLDAGQNVHADAVALDEGDNGVVRDSEDAIGVHSDFSAIRSSYGEIKWSP